MFHLSTYWLHRPAGRRGGGRGALGGVAAGDTLGCLEALQEAEKGPSPRPCRRDLGLGEGGDSGHRSHPGRSPPDTPLLASLHFFTPVLLRPDAPSKEAGACHE